ncbi:MAG: hypothetical protein CMJ18_08875 [Phycisphaeraceae bacterium]|nr:hypothetical protein [Phycisphaeraceae bacterium]
MITHDRLIQSETLYLADLPTPLEGLRIAHLSDIHISRQRRRWRRIIRLMRQIRVDLVLMTGDYITTAGQEPVGARVMTQLIESLQPRLGTYGVFGNHDTWELRQLLDDLTIRWLDNEALMVDGLPLKITGFEADPHAQPDSVAALFDAPGAGTPESGACPVHLLLCHYPFYLPVAADLGVDVMFTGHTHGGQCRLPGGRALVNSTDLPLRLTSGILRHRDTIAVVSRGLGEVRIPLRLFCPPHVLIYTLRSGPMHGRYCDDITNVQPW